MPNLDKNPQGDRQGTSSIYRDGTTPNTRSAVSQKVRLLAPAYGDKALRRMGAVSSFNPSESKSVETMMGIGFGDQIAELVPGPTEAMTASFERTLLYLSNLWQATGYAAGVDGPVRSLRHHRWPFDIEQQLALSSLADADLNAANVGVSGTAFDGGTKAVSFPEVTVDNGPQAGGAGSISGGNFREPVNRGHSAIITIYEACWFTSWSASFSKDAGIIMESGDVTITDVHDFSSVYGEFLATGNDPTIGQLGSVRYTENGFRFQN